MASTFPASLDNFPTSLVTGDAHTAQRQNDNHDAINKMQARALGMSYPYDVLLCGPEAREAEAFLCDVSATYAWQGSALGASNYTMLSGLDMTVRWALARFVWTPNATGCGLRIVKADDGPTNIVQIAEVTGDASTTPIKTYVTITSEIQDIIANVTSQGDPGGANTKTLGWQGKGNGSVAPRVFSIEINMLLGWS